MSEKSFKIDTISPCFQGHFTMNKVLLKHTLYQGGWSKTIERELFAHGDAVLVLLYDSNKEEVILVEQFRVGAIANANKNGDASQAWLLEPVAGMIDLGETAEEAGIREANEEAGVVIEQLEYVCQFYPSPGAYDEVLHLYAAEVSSTDVSDYAGLEDEHEDIRVVKISFSEAKQRLLNAEFNVASTLIALQWLFFQKLSG